MQLKKAAKRALTSEDLVKALLREHEPRLDPQLPGESLEDFTARRLRRLRRKRHER